MWKGEIPLQLLHAPWLRHSHWLLIDGPLDGWVTAQNLTKEKHHQYHQYKVDKNQSEIPSLLKISVKWQGWIFLVHIVEHTPNQKFALFAKFAPFFFSFFFLIDQQIYFIAKYLSEESLSQRLTEVRQWMPSPFQLKGKSAAVWIHNSKVIMKVQMADHGDNVTFSRIFSCFLKEILTLAMSSNLWCLKPLTLLDFTLRTASSQKIRWNFTNNCFSFLKKSTTKIRANKSPPICGPKNHN